MDLTVKHPRVEGGSQCHQQERKGNDHHSFPFTAEM
jgi:hypothetical protein